MNMNISININILYILIAFIVAMAAVYILYSIIIPRSGDGKRDGEFQLTTKNILEHVKILFDQEEYALVQLLAMKYLERMPSHIEVRQYLANAYFKDKKFNNAIKQCMILLRLDPNNMATKKILGECYIKKGSLNKAIKEFEEVFEHQSNDTKVVRTLAELYKDTEQIYSAISVYNILSGLLTSNDEIADVRGILAELNEQARDYPAAFEAYKTRLGIYPTDIETNKKLANLYIKLNNQSKAIETLLYMLSFVSEPKDLLWVYENLIDLYVETEEYERAIEYSEKLLDVQGADKFKVRTNIANLNLKLHNFDTGIGMLEELVMMSQNGYEVTVELANAYKDQKRYEQALEQYTILLDKATQKEAKSVRSLICALYIDWAIDAASSGNHEEAFNNLNKASEYDALNPEIYFNKAEIYFEQKNYTSCIDYLNRALEYDKFNDYHAKYRLRLAEAHHEMGNFFEEKKALTDLLKIDPKNAMGLYRSGLMYVAQHDTKSAEDCFNEALASDPQLVHAKYNLALIYESNNKDKAKELFREVLEEDPSFKEARQALAELSSSENYY